MGYPAEHVTPDGEVLEFAAGSKDTPLGRATSDLATFKFHLIETIAGDPLCDAQCLSATVALITRYLSVDKRTLKPTTPYISITKLMAQAGIKSRTTAIRVRKKLVELGYWVLVGQTKEGCPKYRIENPRDELVRMHVRETEEYLAECEVNRKENERRKRFGQTATGGPNLTPPQKGEGATECTDRGPYIDPNSLRVLRGKNSSREEDPSLAPLSPCVLDPDDPLPRPATLEGADDVVSDLLDGCEDRPSVLEYFRNKLMDGTLTLTVIDAHKALQRRVA